MAAADAGCAFCRIVAGEAPAHVVLDHGDVVAFLDARPVFKGHTLVAPRAHHETLADLPDDLLPTVFTATRRVALAVESALDAGGAFVALNNRVSQSVPHLHVHVVPRTRGDGLRGFFWPRTRYSSDAEAESFAERLRTVLRS